MATQHITHRRTERLEQYNVNFLPDPLGVPPLSKMGIKYRDRCCLMGRGSGGLGIKSLAGWGLNLTDGGRERKTDGWMML